MKALRFSPKLKIKLKPLTSREKGLTVLFLILAVAAGYYHMVFKRQWAEIKDLKAEIIQQETLINEMSSKNYNSIGDMEAEIKDYEEKIRQMKMLVPDYRDIPGVLVEVYRLIKENRLVSDQNISIGKMKEVKNYSTYSLGLQVTGLSADVYSFLTSLESFNRAVIMKRVDFTPEEGGALKADIEFEVCVMHEIQPDPVDYSFMQGNFGVDSPVKMFKHPKTDAGSGEESAIPGNPLLQLYNKMLNPQLPVSPPGTPAENKGDE